MKLKAPPNLTHIQTSRAAYPIGSDGLIDIEPDSPDIPYLLERGFAEPDSRPDSGQTEPDTDPDIEPDHQTTTKRPKKPHTNKENDHE
jgi:hypothetical protein